MKEVSVKYLEELMSMRLEICKVLRCLGDCIDTEDFQYIKGNIVADYDKYSEMLVDIGNEIERIRKYNG